MVCGAWTAVRPTTSPHPKPIGVPFSLRGFVGSRAVEGWSLGFVFLVVFDSCYGHSLYSPSTSKCLSTGPFRRASTGDSSTLVPFATKCLKEFYLSDSDVALRYSTVLVMFSGTSKWPSGGSTVSPSSFGWCSSLFDHSLTSS